MSPTEFIRFIECAENQKRLMARILLSVCGYADQFPVDVAEMAGLSPFQPIRRQWFSKLGRVESRCPAWGNEGSRRGGQDW